MSSDLASITRVAAHVYGFMDCTAVTLLSGLLRTRLGCCPLCPLAGYLTLARHSINPGPITWASGRSLGWICNSPAPRILAEPQVLRQRPSIRGASVARWDSGSGFQVGGLEIDAHSWIWTSQFHRDTQQHDKSAVV